MAQICDTSSYNILKNDIKNYLNINLKKKNISKCFLKALIHRHMFSVTFTAYYGTLIISTVCPNPISSTSAFKLVILLLN